MGTIPVIRREDTGGSSKDKSHSAPLSLRSGSLHKGPDGVDGGADGGGGDCTGVQQLTVRAVPLRLQGLQCLQCRCSLSVRGVAMEGRSSDVRRTRN